MKKHISIFIICLALLITGCQKDLSPLEETTFVRPLNLAEEQLVESGKLFGLKLLAAVNTVQPETNLFLSPLSVSMALGMTLNGAEGETYQAIRQTLELDGLSLQEINENYRSLYQLLVAIDPKVIFENANSLWIRKGFSVLPPFIETNKTYFNAEVRTLDFTQPAAVDIINRWVAQKTHNKITDILDRIPDEAALYLINAIYFKALWLYQFDKKYTRQEDFHVSPSQTITCSMMKITEAFNYYGDEQAQIVELPYGNGSFTMTALLPAENYSVDDLIVSLVNGKWAQYLENMEKKKGTVTMPKFKTEYFIGLKEVLSNMGMAVAFSPAADFSRINPDEQLFISRVLHKTFVQVDEEGTEAAAATVVEVVRTSADNPGLDFSITFNRPFVFIIREKHSGTILFAGKLVKPQWNEE